MRPESVEIVVTLAGSNVRQAITTPELPHDQGSWSILFYVDVTTGAAQAGQTTAFCALAIC